MSRQTYPTQLRDHLGNEVRLPAKPFATGGEGAVFDVVGRPDLVAKLYSKQQSSERCEKLRAMAKLCRPELLKIAAWPTATLSNGNTTGVEGILMPRIVDHKEIHELYSVAQRKKNFPEADWGFLLHTARNCAIAFESIHAHGHIVGDVNQKNVMVSKKGIVAMVDCDSFQVKEGNRIFRCGVGVPEYTPPELHGKRFTDLDRNANHDLFGLAVMVFHLLMMGRHPFAGVPQVKVDIDIPKAIQDGLYAYARNPSKLKPPPNVPPLTMLDAPTRDLFERAFGSHQRPTAAEWRSVLDASMRGLQRCKNDPKHSYPAAAGSCPWCQLITVARLMFFIPSQGAAGAALRIDDILNLIQKLGGIHLVITPYARPRPILPVQVTLPTNLRAIQKPALLSYPSPPAPIQKPTLAPSPPKPVMSPIPKLHAKPPVPVYPLVPTTDPPDLFMEPFYIALIVAGGLMCFISPPVGVGMMVGFGTWLLLTKLTERMRFENAQKSLNAAHEAQCEEINKKYEKRVQRIELANRKILAPWEAENSSRQASYDQARREIELENQGLISAWNALTASRLAEHSRKCNEIDIKNRQIIATWEAANAPWISEHNRWRDRASAAEAEIKRMEAELAAQRQATVSRFQQRKAITDSVLKSHDGARQDYERELHQAEMDSKRIQLEEHLDKWLIRRANLNRIKGDLILALESFGIETAKDVAMLKHQKVPGIGPVLSERLSDWRDKLASSFRPKPGIPESEQRRIGSRYAPVLLPLGQALESAINDLETIATSHRASEAARIKAIAAAVQSLAEAEAYVRAIKLV